MHIYVCCKDGCVGPMFCSKLNSLTSTCGLEEGFDEPPMTCKSVSAPHAVTADGISTDFKSTPRDVHSILKKYVGKIQVTATSYEDSSVVCTQTTESRLTQIKTTSCTDKSYFALKLAHKDEFVESTLNLEHQSQTKNKAYVLIHKDSFLELLKDKSIASQELLEDSVTSTLQTKDSFEASTLPLRHNNLFSTIPVDADTTPISPLKKDISTTSSKVVCNEKSSLLQSTSPLLRFSPKERCLPISVEDVIPKTLCIKESSSLPTLNDSSKELLTTHFIDVSSNVFKEEPLYSESSLTNGDIFAPSDHNTLQSHLFSENTNSLPNPSVNRVGHNSTPPCSVGYPSSPPVIPNDSNVKDFWISNESSEDGIKTFKVEKKYVRNKHPTAFCLYCKKRVVEIARHLQKLHKNESEVQKLLSLPEGSLERRSALVALRKRENDVHYQQEENKCGQPSKFYPFGGDTCPNCLGFYSKKYLYSHVKLCLSKKPENVKKGLTLREALRFLVKGGKLKTTLESVIIPNLAADKVSWVAREDIVIVLFGIESVKGYKKCEGKVELTCRKMKELARLSQELQKRSSNINDLLDGLKSENLDLLIELTKSVGKYNVEENSFESQSNILRIIISLTQCCEVAISSTKQVRYLLKGNIGDEVISGFNSMKLCLEKCWKHELSTLTEMISD